jgi:benzylsuccinate CoA-transferase BbsF subunit
MDYQVNARIKGRGGNADDSYCPHGIYPCQGQDRWIAIVATNDREWGMIGRLIGEDWAANPIYAILAGRKANETEINSRLARWTLGQVAEELMTCLQGNGIPAGVVQDGRDILNDPQLAHRQAIWYLDHDEVGEHNVFGLGFSLSRNPPPPPKAGPRFGEHTFQVCQEVLGMSDDEITKLIGEGILQV